MNVKDLLSLANLGFGVLALVLSVFGAVNFTAALALFALAAFFDYVDGKVARFFKPDNFGKQLDSLCDLASFGVSAPLVAAFFYPGNVFLSCFGIVVFACAAAVRLARFNLQKEASVFFGLPVPAAALVLLALAPLVRDFVFVVMVVLGLLMVSRFKLKKVF